MQSAHRRNSRQLTRFFIPLAIQAASQALSYPLIAMVASRGPVAAKTTSVGQVS
jgi:hypothetical protein